jgi:hypothetical protein
MKYRVRLGRATLLIANSWDALGYLLTISFAPHPSHREENWEDDYFIPILCILGKWITVLGGAGRGIVSPGPGRSRFAEDTPSITDDSPPA